MSDRPCPLCDRTMPEIVLPDSLSRADEPIRVERCETCAGIFLDRSETEQSLGLEEEILAREGTKKLPPKDNPLRCPACGDTMDVYSSMGAMLDVCSGCQGIWLDKGELEALRDYQPGADAAGESPQEGGLRNLMDRVAALSAYL